MGRSDYRKFVPLPENSKVQGGTAQQWKTWGEAGLGERLALQLAARATPAAPARAAAARSRRPSETGCWRPPRQPPRSGRPAAGRTGRQPHPRSAPGRPGSADRRSTPTGPPPFPPPHGKQRRALLRIVQATLINGIRKLARV